MVDDLFGWEDHQLRFGQVQLKVVIFHPCEYISQTVRDPRRDRGVLRRESQKQLSIIGITVIGKTMRVDDRAQRGGVDGKEKWSYHRGTPVVRRGGTNSGTCHDTLNERPVRYESNQECALPEMPILDSMDKRIRWLTVSNAAD